MCYDKEADGGGAVGGDSAVGGAGEAGAGKPRKPHKLNRPVVRRGICKPKGKHKWSLAPGQKKASSGAKKRGAFAGLLSAHGM